jgi:hypothetical protein
MASRAQSSESLFHLSLPPYLIQTVRLSLGLAAPAAPTDTPKRKLQETTFPRSTANEAQVGLDNPLRLNTGLEAPRRHLTATRERQKTAVKLRSRTPEGELGFPSAPDFGSYSYSVLTVKYPPTASRGHTPETTAPSASRCDSAQLRLLAKEAWNSALDPGNDLLIRIESAEAALHEFVVGSSTRVPRTITSHANSKPPRKRRCCRTQPQDRATGAFRGLEKRLGSDFKARTWRNLAVALMGYVTLRGTSCET